MSEPFYKDIFPDWSYQFLGWRTPVSNCYQLKRSKQPNSPWPWEDSIWREGACAPQKTIEATPFGPCFLDYLAPCFLCHWAMSWYLLKAVVQQYDIQINYQVWPERLIHRKRHRFPNQFAGETYLQNEWNNPIYMKSTSMSMSFKNRTCCAQPISDPNHL